LVSSIIKDQGDKDRWIKLSDFYHEFVYTYSIDIGGPWSLFRPILVKNIKKVE